MVQELFKGNVIQGPTCSELMEKEKLVNFDIYSSCAKLIHKHSDNKMLMFRLIKKYCVERLTSKRSSVIIYCRTQMHAKSVADYLNENMASVEKLKGIKAKFIGSNLGQEKCRDIIEDFKTNKSIHILCTSRMLTEGFNAVNVGVIIFNCRHIKSKTNYIQRIGRMLRKAEGKERSLLLDVGGASKDKNNFSIFTKAERDRGYGKIFFFPEDIQNQIETVRISNHSNNIDSDENYSTEEEEEDSSNDEEEEDTTEEDEENDSTEEEEEDVEDSNTTKHIRSSRNNIIEFLKLLDDTDDDDDDDDHDDLNIDGGKVRRPMTMESYDDDDDDDDNDDHSLEKFQ